MEKQNYENAMRQCDYEVTRLEKCVMILTQYTPSYLHPIEIASPTATHNFKWVKIAEISLL